MSDENTEFTDEPEPNSTSTRSNRQRRRLLISAIAGVPLIVASSAQSAHAKPKKGRGANPASTGGSTP